jgi:acyl transferase domain-containing protein
LFILSSDKWDNKFFGISDSEAGWMDHQQCLALEVTYTALEDGGFTKEKLKGTNTGVYIGKLNNRKYLSFYIL